MKASDARKITEQSITSLYKVALEEVYNKIRAAASTGREEVVLELSARCTDELLITLRREGYKVVAKSSQNNSTLDMIKINW